jgi:hypothetical protein
LISRAYIVVSERCGSDTRSSQMQKSETAWKTAARMAALAEEADTVEEREHYSRMRAAWITLANRCEFLDVPDVTEE